MGPAGKDAKALEASLDAAWGDPEAWTSGGLHWTHHPLVRAAIHRRVSGDAGLAPLPWFFGQVARLRPLPLARVLVLGCGTGAAEREACRRGWAREAVAFDLSPKVVEAARARAGRVPGVRHVQADMDALPVGADPFERASFDAVLGISAVHHSRRVEGLFDDLHALLRPDGWLFLDEYVGPDRFQHSPLQTRQLRLAAELLPDALRTTRSGAVRANYRAPEVAEVVAADPTEAAQSSRILSAMRRRFDAVAVRPYGGGLLRPLLGEITQNFMDGDGEAVLRLLVEAEDELDRLGELQHDFACAIARPRAD